MLPLAYLKAVLNVVALLLSILNVPGSNLGPEAGYNNYDHPWISSVSLGVVVYLKLRNDRFLPHPFQFVIHLSSYCSTLYSLRYR
jgi:hypothetical protein